MAKQRMNKRVPLVRDDLDMLVKTFRSRASRGLSLHAEKGADPRKAWSKYLKRVTKAKPAKKTARRASVAVAS